MTLDSHVSTMFLGLRKLEKPESRRRPICKEQGLGVEACISWANLGGLFEFFLRVAGLNFRIIYIFFSFKEYFFDLRILIYYS